VRERTASEAAPRVSVVVPTRDRPDGLLRLLLALRAQSLDPVTFEAIVVDDGSSAGTNAAIEMARRGARFAIRTVRLSGRGPAAARNAGVAIARARTVAFVDDDCEPECDWLAALVAAAETGEPGAVAGRIVAADATSLAGRYAAAARLLDDPRVERGESGVEPTTANAAFPKNVLDSLGGFDERFVAPGGEETELAARIRARGLPIRSAPRAVVRHRFPDRVGPLFRTAYRYGVGNGIILRREGRRRHAATTALGALALHRLPLAAVAFSRAGASLLDAARFAVVDFARKLAYKAGVVAGAFLRADEPAAPSHLARADAAARPHSLFAQQDVVVVSNQSRHEGPSQPVHQIVKRLRGDHRVLFVEANHSLGKIVLSLLGKPYALAPFGRFRVEEEGRFFVYTPPPRLPFRHFLRPIGRLQQRLLARSVRRAAARAGFESPILWTFVHQSAALVGSLGERLAVYHCVDPWGELIPAAGMGRREVVLEDERETASRVDVVFATAAALRDDLLPHNRASHYVPNAVDAEAVLDSIRRLDPGRDTLAPLPRPRIGFVGAPERKVDAALLEAVARLAPEWTFVLVGPLRNFPGRRQLRKLPNVKLLGPVPPADVPATLSALDVAIIPFSVDPLTRGVSPLKLFEYLAAGPPIVSTPIPEVADLRDVVRIAGDAAAFRREIAEALAEADDPEKLRQRIETAHRNTWDHRVADIARVLETKLRTTSDSRRSQSLPGPAAPFGSALGRDRVRDRVLR